jgi:hypothetical protein
MLFTSRKANNKYTSKHYFFHDLIVHQKYLTHLTFVNGFLLGMANNYGFTQNITEGIKVEMGNNRIMQQPRGNSGTNAKRN